MFQNKGESLRLGRRSDAASTVVRVEALRCFREVVSGLGGDAHGLLSRANIDPALLDRSNATICFRTFVNLLEQAASELGCPDFGMRLAAPQGGTKVAPGSTITLTVSLGDQFILPNLVGMTVSAAQSLLQSRGRAPNR